MVLEVFELMEALKAQVTSPNFPSAHLIISQLKITSPYVNLKSSFDPARDYFLANLPDMRLYRAAEYLNPVKVRILYCFRVFSFLFSCSLAEKRSPSCRSLPVASKSWERQETCKDNCLTTRPLPLDASMGWTSWTGGRRMEPSSQPGELQQKKILCIAPTSAAAERVFSLLNGAVSDRQEGLLNDHLEAMLLLKFNEKKEEE